MLYLLSMFNQSYKQDRNALHGQGSLHLYAQLSSDMSGLSLAMVDSQEYKACGMFQLDC